MSLAVIANQLYAEKPTQTLFHYTSIGALLGIIRSGELCASDVRYFSDAGEMKHTVTLLRNAIAHAPKGDSITEPLRIHFLKWLGSRLDVLGHALFAASFTADGNLLSQWRSYCDPAKGVSIGFSATKLLGCADDQSWQIGKCLYEDDEQDNLARSMLASIESLAQDEFAPPGRVTPNSAYHFFAKFEGDLLRIAALLKHRAFREEKEWRVVSPVTPNYMTAPIEYREGRSMLTPYLRFILPTAADRSVDLDHVRVGPTPHLANAVLAVSNFLSKQRAAPRLGVGYCGIPYRTW